MWAFSLVWRNALGVLCRAAEHRNTRTIRAAILSRRALIGADNAKADGDRNTQ